MADTSTSLRIEPKHKSIEICVLFILFLLPHISLDYVYLDVDMVFYSLPVGQYAFFFGSIGCCLFLLSRFNTDDFFSVLKSRYLAVAIGLVIVGICLSVEKMSSIRLLTIVFILSVCSIYSASILMKLEQDKIWLAMIALILPFLIPVICSFVVEFNHFLDSPIDIHHVKHYDFNPPRWRFLNSSANGFGLDAAISVFGLYCIFKGARGRNWRLLALLLMTLSFLALLLSGTRAAFIFLLIAFLSYEFIVNGIRGISISLFKLIVLCGFTVFITGIDAFIGFLRLAGEIDYVTSGRFTGITTALKAIQDSPFVGLGFGAADADFPFAPSNIFYTNIIVEVGIFGAVGFLMIMLLPLFLIMREISIGSRLLCLKKSIFKLFCFGTFVGFLPYFIFEFSLFRVSVVNQLFFVCWFVLICYFKQQSELQNSRGV